MTFAENYEKRIMHRNAQKSKLYWLIFVLYSLLTFSKGCYFILIIAGCVLTAGVLLHSVAQIRGKREEDCIVIEV